MNEIVSLLCKNTYTPTNIISIGSFTVAIIFLVVSLFNTTIKNQSLKIFASFLILSIATLANNWAVYFISVLIIATLITELNFLENIAAIITNREWWKIDKATKEEIKNQTKKELPESKQTSRVIMETVSTENEILNEFIDQGLFTKENIHRGIVLKSPQKDKFVFNALAETPTIDYIIDVSILPATSNLLKFIQLKNALSIYRSIVPNKNVKGIFITLSEKEIAQYEDADIKVVKYNNKTKQFSNFISLKKWIEMQ